MTCRLLSLENCSTSTTCNFITKVNFSLSKKIVGQFSKGNPHGKNSLLYHKNGKIGFKGCLVNGLKEGVGELFEENGPTLLMGEFKNECFYNGEVILDNISIDYSVSLRNNQEG